MPLQSLCGEQHRAVPLNISPSAHGVGCRAAGTNTVLAVNSFVNNNSCSGVTYSPRIDLPDILGFISGI
jgi:hypothetical protein